MIKYQYRWNYSKNYRYSPKIGVAGKIGCNNYSMYDVKWQGTVEINSGPQNRAFQPVVRELQMAL